jgi:hypothetical protein
VTTMTVSLPGDIIAPRGDKPIIEMLPRGAAPTSQPEVVLQNMLHQERVRTVGIYYWHYQ